MSLLQAIAFAVVITLSGAVFIGLLTWFCISVIEEYQDHEQRVAAARIVLQEARKQRRENHEKMLAEHRERMAKYREDSRNRLENLDG